MNTKFDLYIIDDDPTAIKLMVSMLTKYNIKIKTFTDPVVALEQLAINPPSIVFLDYNMPVLNGSKFIIKMSERFLFQYTSIFLISGIEFDEIAITQFRTLGFSQVIKKPFKENDLVIAITNVIDLVEKKKIAA